MDIEEVAKRLKVAFPNYDIGGIKRVIVGNSRNIVKDRLAWDILIADPITESVKRGDI